PPVTPLGSSWPSCLSLPGSNFELSTRAVVGRPGSERDVSPTIWPVDLPRRPSPERPFSSLLLGRSLPGLPFAEKLLIGPSDTPQPAWSRLPAHAEVTSSASLSNSSAFCNRSPIMSSKLLGSGISGILGVLPSAGSSASHLALSGELGSQLSRSSFIF